MYIQIDEQIKCSKCGSLNHYETVMKKSFSGTETLLRCLTCGHEKIQSTLTINSDSPKKSIYMSNPSDEHTF